MNTHLNDDENNLNNQHITLNAEIHHKSPTQQTTNIKEEQPDQSRLLNFINNPQQALANEVMQRAGEQISSSWMDKFKCFKLE